MATGTEEIAQDTGCGSHTSRAVRTDLLSREKFQSQFTRGSSDEGEVKASRLGSLFSPSLPKAKCEISSMDQSDKAPLWAISLGDDSNQSSEVHGRTGKNGKVGVRM